VSLFTELMAYPLLLLRGICGDYILFPAVSIHGRIPSLLLELERLTAIFLSHDLVAIEYHLRNLRTDFVIQSLSDLSDWTPF
jgi:hypothetical protein